MMVSVPACVTVATIANVTLAPCASAAISQTPVSAVYVPCEGVALTTVSPAGRRSVTCTPVASDGQGVNVSHTGQHSDDLDTIGNRQGKNEIIANGETAQVGQ